MGLDDRDWVREESARKKGLFYDADKAKYLLRQPDEKKRPRVVKSTLFDKPEPSVSHFEALPTAVRQRVRSMREKKTRKARRRASVITGICAVAVFAACVIQIFRGIS